MFEIGFLEIFLLGVIALLVVGPDRLPGLARTVGVWVGKAQRLVGQVRADIEREVRADELRKAAKEYSPAAALSDMRKEVEGFASEVSRPVDLDADDGKPNAGDARPTGPAEAGAGGPKAAAPKAADRPAGAGEAGAGSGEPASGDAARPGAPAGASGGMAGAAPAAGPETAPARSPEGAGSGRVDPPSSAPEGGGTRESEGAAPPAMMGGPGTPRVERDERTAAP